MIALAIVLQDVPPAAGLVCIFALLLSTEWAFPLRRRSRALLGRLPANVVTSALALCAGALIVRPVAGYGMPTFLRVSIGTERENARFLDVLTQVLQQ